MSELPTLTRPSNLTLEGEKLSLELFSLEAFEGSEKKKWKNNRNVGLYYRGDLMEKLVTGLCGLISNG